jgi:hypothetical protein
VKIWKYWNCDGFESNWNNYWRKITNSNIRINVALARLVLNAKILQWSRSRGRTRASLDDWLVEVVGVLLEVEMGEPMHIETLLLFTGASKKWAIWSYILINLSILNNHYLITFYFVLTWFFVASIVKSNQGNEDCCHKYRVSLRSSSASKSKIYSNAQTLFTQANSREVSSYKGVQISLVLLQKLKHKVLHISLYTCKHLPKSCTTRFPYDLKIIL